MPLNIIVTSKQVIDPDMPVSAFKVDNQTNQVVLPANADRVTNGFDEHALEAALRIKDVQESKITVLSMGTDFSLDVMKKSLAMGADELVLLQDNSFINSLDSYFTASVLAKAISKLGKFDLIISGRQASDWDNAQVHLGIAECLKIPCITVVKSVEVKEDKVIAQRIVPEGYELVDCSLPTMVTVSNELGLPRYPTLKGIMAAARKDPIVWNAEDLDINGVQFSSRVNIVHLFVRTSDRQCQFIEGNTDEEKGQNLALKLRESKVI